MKKYRIRGKRLHGNKTILLLILFFISVITVYSGNVSGYVRAENSSADTKYYIELSDRKVYAPALTKNGERYTASLFSVSDADFTNSLTDNFHSDGYTFSACGAYKIKYFITVISTGLLRQEISELVIADNTPPEIRIDDILAEYAEIGDKVVLPQFSAVDLSAGEVSKKIEAFVNGQKTPIDDGKIAVEKQGKYTIVYTATDVFGNSDSKEMSFISLEKGEANNQIGFNSNLIWIIGGALLLVVIAASVTILIKRKKT